MMNVDEEAMQSSAYRAPESVDQAIEILGEESGARVLAGGTDLIVQIRGGRPEPSVFVDVKRIPQLMQIRSDADAVTIGAAVPAAEIFEHAEIRDSWPGLSEAVNLIGSTQIQGRATLGGNLCNGSPAADTTPALIAARASCLVMGKKGGRNIPVEDFVTGPGETVLSPDELLVQFLIPRPEARSADAYQRLIPRSEMDIAVVGAAAAIRLGEDGSCAGARIVIGAVAPTARLIEAAGDAIQGSQLDEASLQRAADAAMQATEPIDDKRGSIVYRRKVTGVLVKRVIQLAAERAQGRS
jgi:carbon-monoxide dehydrogenase medium subunit